VIVAAQPAALCFRSDEPKLNPNSLVDLGVMRRQLTAYLKLVQGRERVLSQRLTPKTPEQIRIAEAILNSALKDLAARKQFLQGREAKKSATKPTGAAPAKRASVKKAAAKKTGRRKK
jgi:hypothetical protein